jgi:hypothetical protein
MKRNLILRIIQLDSYQLKVLTWEKAQIKKKRWKVGLITVHLRKQEKLITQIIKLLEHLSLMIERRKIVLQMVTIGIIQ